MNQIMFLAMGLMLGFSSSLGDTTPLPRSTLPIVHSIELPAVKRSVREVREVWITAYSSTPEETDDSPFVTASGSRVRDGILAANFLPFGAEVQIPETFGDKIFVVEDRMHHRKTNNIDVWMASKSEALEFGRQYATIVVLE